MASDCPKALLFDLGDTLLHESAFESDKANRYLFSIAANPRNVPYEAVRERVAELNAVIYPVKDALQLEVSWSAFNRLVFDYFGMTLPCTLEQAEMEFWRRATRRTLAPGLASILADLSERHIPMGIISNAAFSGRTLRLELEDKGILSRFAFLIASSDVGFRKPHPGIFLLGAAMLGFPAESICFIGDNYDLDFLASKKAGMQSLHYIGKGGVQRAGDSETLRSWDAFSGHIRRFWGQPGLVP